MRPSRRRCASRIPTTSSSSSLKYLSDAHAIENQAIQLLEKGEKIAGDPVLAQLYDEHLGETREHAGSSRPCSRRAAARRTRSRTRRCGSAR